MARRLPRLPEWGTANRLSWRVTLVQFLANAIVLGLVIGLLPGFELHARHPFVAILWLAVVLGVLTALVRPLLEFMLLPYLLQSLGLVVIVIDAALLALLGLTSTLEIDGFWALVAGAVLAGVLGFVLDGLLGLTPPVVDDATVRAERGERLVRIAGDLRAAPADAAVRATAAVRRRHRLRSGPAAPGPAARCRGGCGGRPRRSRPFRCR